MLRSLYLFREEEAVRQHRPPFFVLPDDGLTFLAANPRSDLSDVPGLGQTGLKRFGEGILKAVQRGMTAPPVNRPRLAKFVRSTEEQIKRFGKLKEWRTAMGARLSLDPSLLWPMPSLERLSREPNSLNTELNHESIRNWQREVVAPGLKVCLSTLG